MNLRDQFRLFSPFFLTILLLFSWVYNLDSNVVFFVIIFYSLAYLFFCHDSVLILSYVTSVAFLVVPGLFASLIINPPERLNSALLLSVPMLYSYLLIFSLQKNDPSGQKFFSGNGGFLADGRILFFSTVVLFLSAFMGGGFYIICFGIYGLISRHHNGKPLTVFAMLVSVAVFIIFSWSGFGRLMVVSIFQLAVLSTFRSLKYQNLYLLSAFLLGPLLLPLSMLGRTLDSLGAFKLESYFLDSNFHFAFVMSRFDIIERELSLFEWLSQFILFFLNWFPRFIWNEKPVSIGFSAVSAFYGDRADFDDGFTISTGLMGASLIFGSSFAIILFLIEVLVVGFTFRFLSRIERLDLGYLRDCFIVLMPHYVWGGAGTFGSRFWFLAIPTLSVLLVVYWFPKIVNRY